VQRRVAPRVPDVHVRALLLDQELHGGEERVRHVVLLERAEAEVATARGGVDRPHVVRARRDERKPRILLLPSVRLATRAQPDLTEHGRLVRVGAGGGEQLHGLDVLRERGAPEGRGPGDVEPILPSHSHDHRCRVIATFGLAPFVEQRLEHLEVRRLRVVLRARLRLRGEAQRPLGLERREERTDAVVLGDDVHVGAALDQRHRQVELDRSAAPARAACCRRRCAR
jgi:hypothetical protein